MNYGRGSDYGASFFGDNIGQVLRMEELGVLPYHMFSRAQYTDSRYSNASSPGTSYSGSSGNSQSNFQSPNEFDINSLIHKSLCHLQDNDNINDIPSDGTSNKCLSCVNINCDVCFPSRYFQPFQFGPQGEYLRGIYPNLLKSPNSPIRQLPVTCEMHPDSTQFYCHTCSKAFCGECGLFSHHGHVTTTFIVAIKEARVRARDILKEVRIRLTAFRQKLDRVQNATEILEQKSKQASTDVIFGIRRITTLLKTREKELLTKIDNMRREKLAALKSKYDGLRRGINRLTVARNGLNEAIKSIAVNPNPLSLLIHKDTAMAEVIKVRREFQILSRQGPHCWVSFKCSEEGLLNALANFGKVIQKVPGAIGDRRAVRGRGNSPQVFMGRPLTSPPVPLPLPRTIVNTFPVTVRLNRNYNMPIRASVIIGNNNNVPEDNLCRPWGVACDGEGHVIVADRSNNRIQIYKQNGSFVRRFGTHGTGPGEFDRPAGVAVDARRRIIVADKDNHRIQILTMEGFFLLAFGEKGCRCGQFNYPWDVAVNSQCQIIVSDTRNHRVQLFSAEGVFLRKYGYEGAPNMWKHFDSPRGVAFNVDGNIVTSDFNNHKLLTIDYKFTHARVFQCESPGTSKLFLRPQGLVIDDDGNVVVADSRNHRIQIFDRNGNLKCRFGSLGKGDDEMDRPSGIALCPNGRIAVVDFGNNRVLIF